MLCHAHWLGQVEYREAYKMQTALSKSRLAGAIPDTILFLEHTPVITLGKTGNVENIRVSQEELAKRNIALLFVDRGGDVTYHCPGQLVIYPIIDLRNRNKDLHQYVYDLEEVLILTLKNFGIDGQRDSGHPGVWIHNQEIAAIGLNVKKWITRHGMALNVNPDLGDFSIINPCGFVDRRVTSIAKLLGWDVKLEAVISELAAHFCDVFDFQVTWPTGVSGGSHS